MRRSPYGFDLYETCSECEWRGEGFFCNFDPASMEAIDQVAFTNVAAQHSILFSEGEAPRGVYLVCHGKVKQSIAAGDGKTLIVHVSQAGEALGLDSVVSGTEYHVTAETLEPTQVKFVKHDDFLKLMDEIPDAWKNACRQLAFRAQIDNEQIRSIGLSHSAAEKLAHLILTWSEENGRLTDDGTKIQVLMTHQDMSQLIGTSRETVTRLLKEFRDRNIVSIKGSTLTIHNKAALEALVAM